MSLRTGTLLLLLGALLTLLPGRAHACAGCSNPNLPLGRNANVLLAPGKVQATVNLTALTTKVVHSEHCPDIGPVCAERDEPPQLHDQRFYIAELRPIVEVGLTEVLGLELQLPFRVTNTDITFRRLDGTAFEPDYANIHHRDETLAGIADPWLSGRAGWRLGRVLLTTRLGLTVPLGSTEEDPFARGRAGLSHQHIQFGTGTFNPILGVDAGLTLGRYRLATYAQGFFTLYENGKGYRAGHRFSGGATVETTPFGKLRVGVGADLLNEQPEKWNGLVQQDGNVGRTDLLAGLVLGHPVGPVSLSLSVKAPVWQRFIERGHRHDGDPGQLTYPAVVNLAVTQLF